jgi:hypothetical protein
MENSIKSRYRAQKWLLDRDFIGDSTDTKSQRRFPLALVIC